jgi:hypothetical protein
MTPTRLVGQRVLLTQADQLMGPALASTFEAQGATVIADTRALHGDPGCTIRRAAGCRSCGRAAAEARARLAFAAMRRRVLWSRCFRSAGGG